MKKIFLTGGAGYCGSILVPMLLEKGYFVTVYDTLFFGNCLEPNNNLEVIKGDIRDSDKIEKNLYNHDYFVSLACISNDSSFELDEKLSTSINLNAFEPMVKAAKKRESKDLYTHHQVQFMAYQIKKMLQKNIL